MPRRRVTIILFSSWTTGGCGSLIPRPFAAEQPPDFPTLHAIQLYCYPDIPWLSATEAAQNARKLVTEDKVDALMGSVSLRSTTQVAQIAHESRTPLIALA